MKLRDFDNIHTHKLRDGAVWNADPILLRHNLYIISPEVEYFTVGIHPWHTEVVTEADVMAMKMLATDPRCLGIGEAGLDPLRGGNVAEQETLLRKHILLSEELQKPLVLHIVKAWDVIMRLRKELKPTQEWIIHGFRGKPELATRLLDNGFSLSIGKKYNPETLKIIPKDRLYFETD